MLAHQGQSCRKSSYFYLRTISLTLSLVSMIVNPLNISPLGNGSKAYGLGMISTEGTHCSPEVSHPWPGQPTHCWQRQLVTDGVLITTLGTRLRCVQAPFSVSWLCILVEVFGMELGLKASREQVRCRRVGGLSRDRRDLLQVFPLPHSVGEKKQNKSLTSFKRSPT